MTRKFTALICALAALTASSALAQGNQPVIAPWSVDNTDTQSRIRQYENFRSLNAGPQASSQKQDDDYTAASTPSERTNNALPPPLRTIQSTHAAQQTASAIEDLYAERIIDESPQFGYDLFGVPSPAMMSTLESAADSSPSIPSGAVQDNFVLSTGDELEIFFTGQRTDRGLYKVNSQGQIILTDFPPIPAAGRTIGQVRISMEAAAQNLHNTVPYVSLASVRQIGILVVGHAKRPGRQTLTVFHTVLDALMEAGGIEKTGSLRQIKLVRDGRSTVIDLYGLLLHGAANMDLQLRDGDRLIIPPIGPTVAIAGEVKRPGIYEILPQIASTRFQAQQKSERLTLNEMLELSGGVLAPGKNRFIKLEITPAGEEKTTEITEPLQPQFGDGAILSVAKGSEKRGGGVELAGHTRRPGIFALKDNPALSALLSSDDVLGPDIYPLIGVIERYDEDQLTRTLIDFPPRLVLKGQHDDSLREGDVVHLFSNSDIESLTAPPPLLDQGDNDSDTENSATLLHDDPVMVSFLREHAAFLRGAVRKPGEYPVSKGIALENLISVAGGMTLEADLDDIEVTSTAPQSAQKNRQKINLDETNSGDILIAAGDAIRINQKFAKPSDKSVLILGEVKNPGRYDLLPGDKVSDLMQRAGGLNDQAYPLGAIFSRQTERKAEEARFHAQASAMEQSIAAALQADEEKVNAGKIAEARSLAAELRNAKGVGRITVETDPAVLATTPELDMLLEPGDRLFIPKRNLTVRVSGEILSPASLQFREKKNPIDYINEAGGFTFDADKDRTFVLYPDGSAQPLQVSSWNYNAAMIPPGSTIVVPRDPKPFDFIQSAKDVSQILSNLAISAIFIDDLGDE
jgi:polysaccharide export outer membrane protein